MYGCTCPKANYHIALDTNLEATKDEFMGHYTILNDNDDEDNNGDDNNNAIVTPIYTEPYWSGDVGVTIYRKMDSNVGYILLSVGLVFGIGSAATAFWIRRYMFQHKLY